MAKKKRKYVRSHGEKGLRIRGETMLDSHGRMGCWEFFETNGRETMQKGVAQRASSSLDSPALARVALAGAGVPL